MLRIPGSLNSDQIRLNDRGEIIGDIPPEAEVRIIQPWDGNGPSIKPLLPRYYIWLQAVAKDIDRQMEARKYNNNSQSGWRWGNSSNNNIDWIDKLLQITLEDFRKYCIWRVPVPYFINVKGLSRLETFDAVKSWLDKCDTVSKLRSVCLGSQ
jgi:Primase X